MQTASLVATATIGFAVLFTHTAVTDAADIKVLSTNAFRPVISQLASQFDRTSGHKVTISFVGGPDLVKRQIDAGETADVAISTSGVIDDLIKAGKIVAATQASLARTGVGVAVRAGTAKVDIGSAEALKRTLLNAKSIAYATEGRSGPHFLGVLERLGIAEATKPKLRPLTTPTSIAAVANGEAEMAVLLVSGIISASGVELAGSLPAELQLYLGFAAGVGTDSKQPEAASALIKFLTAPAAGPVIRANGMEPG
jgi:molybdate transport system substrate-binding protein